MPENSTPRSETSRTWLTGALYWMKITAGPGGMGAVTSAFTLVALTLLFRVLPPAEAGRLALLLALVEILALAAGLGITTVILRVYPAQASSPYDWQVDLLRTAVLAALMGVIGTGIAGAIYDLSLALQAYLALVIPLMVSVHAASSALAASGRYTWSSGLLRLPNALLVVPAVGAVLHPAWARLEDVLVFHVLASLAILGLALFVVHRSIPRGDRPIDARQRLLGLTFLAAGATYLLPDHGLMAVAARILTPETLAAYAAVTILLRPFRLARSVLATILTPDLVRHRRSTLRRLLVGLWLAAGAAAVAAAIGMPIVAQWFYGDRYPAGIALIPLLALAGGIHVITVLPKSELSGRAPGPLATRFVVVLLGVMLAVLALGAALVRAAGLLGLAVSLIALELAECGVSHLFWVRYRRHEGSIASASPDTEGASLESRGASTDSSG